SSSAGPRHALDGQCRYVPSRDSCSAERVCGSAEVRERRRRGWGFGAWVRADEGSGGTGRERRGCLRERCGRHGELQRARVGGRMQARVRCGNGGGSTQAEKEFTMGGWGTEGAPSASFFFSFIRCSADVVYQPCGRQQRAPGRCRAAACADSIVPALYCTQKTREVAGKTGYAREGLGGTCTETGSTGRNARDSCGGVGGVHGSGIARRTRLCAPCLSRRARRRDVGTRASAFGAFSRARSPPCVLHLGDTADAPLHVRLPSPRFASFLPRGKVSPARACTYFYLPPY
ncbi:hypothetical protein FB451DRAFT_1481867, partial [Mycena latifolia]